MKGDTNARVPPRKRFGQESRAYSSFLFCFCRHLYMYPVQGGCRALPFRAAMQALGQLMVVLAVRGDKTFVANVMGWPKARLEVTPIIGSFEQVAADSSLCR